jgi:hypothetical protein
VRFQAWAALNRSFLESMVLLSLRKTYIFILSRLGCERIFYALPLSFYNQKLPTRRRLREFSSFLCVCGVEDDDDAASEVQQRARGRV